MLNFVHIPDKIAQPGSNVLMEGFDGHTKRIESEGTRGIAEHLTCHSTYKRNSFISFMIKHHIY